MSNNQLTGKIQFIANQPEEVKIALVYRCLTLAVTSLFFLVGYSRHPLVTRIFIILCVAAASGIASNLYIKNKGNKTKIAFLLILETLGNSFILIPSGGILSPFVWYSLNTILIASLELGRKFCWLSLSMYILVSTWASYFVLNTAKEDFLGIINKELNIVLSLILITLAIQLLSKYLQKIQLDKIKLRSVNNELTSANEKIKESMNYVMELYQAVHLFSMQSGKYELIDIIVRYAKKITKAESAFFYSPMTGDDKLVVASDRVADGMEEEIKKILDEERIALKDAPEPLLLCSDRTSILAVTVKTNYRTYGVLGIEPVHCEGSHCPEETLDRLKFLAGLSFMVLERFELERVNEKLMVSEEQNRIANEIHDSVLQKLFGISCGIFGLMKNQNLTAVNETARQLQLLQQSVNDTMKDLRAVVYRLSWKKGGVNSFIADVNKFLSEARRLNNVEINLHTAGNSELLLPSQKKALYRIICEGTGNAIRHGKAGAVNVSLKINHEAVLLEIKDNGIGFDFEAVRESHALGLGIENIQNMVCLMKGKVDFNSNAGKGTLIKIFIPVCNPGFYKEDAV